MPAAKQNHKDSDVQLKVDHEILLQTILDELQDGVIVCAPDATITLFNKTAADLFDCNHSISPGASLYTLVLRAPVEHALELLYYQSQEETSDHETHP